jgi:tetratricopeptide (TPR) repeat protein
VGLYLVVLLCSGSALSFKTQAFQTQAVQTQDDPQAADREQARQLLVEAGALIKDIPESEQSTFAHNLLLEITRVGDLSSALGVVAMLKRPEDQMDAIGSIAWKLTDSGKLNEALSLIETLKVDETEEVTKKKDETYYLLMDNLVRKNDVEQGLRVSHLIRNPGRRAQALVYAAVLRARAGDRSGARKSLAEALEIIEEAIPGNANLVYVLGTIAQAEGEVGEVPETSRALQQLSAVAYQQKQQTGQTYLLEQLVRTEAHSGHLARASEIIHELSPHNSDTAYAAIAEAQAKGGRMDEALAAADQIAEPSLRSGMLGVIAGERQARGYLMDALEAVNRIDQPAQRAEALAKLACEQAWANNPAAYLTLQLWHTTSNDGADATDSEREKVAVAYGWLGDFSTAKRILRSIEKSASRSWALWNLTELIVMGGETQEAIDLARQETVALSKAHALLGTAEGILNRLDREARAARTSE